MEAPRQSIAATSRDLAGGPPVDLNGTDLGRLASALADQFAVLYDARPLDPRASFADQVLAFSFDGGLARSDEWLLRAGRDEQLCDFREQFMRVIERDLDNVVEALSGCQVVRFVSSFDPTTRVTDCFFTLAKPPGSEREQRQALLNWSEQVRRNAQASRKRHHEAVEAHARLRDMVQDVRRTRQGDAPSDTA
jgi:uncharacterized protein YbcI